MAPKKTQDYYKIYKERELWSSAVSSLRIAMIELSKISADPDMACEEAKYYIDSIHEITTGNGEESGIAIIIKALTDKLEN
jgi:hypothetical protein